MSVQSNLLQSNSTQAASPDIKAYFKRLGYNGKQTPELEVLEAIHLLHPQIIPFENLNPLLRLPVMLDLRSLEEKLIHSKRGGFCFEHNLLLSHMLRELGFNVKGLAARVLWNQPEGRVKARSHMLLLVYVDKSPFIVDVGFGGLTLTAPLQLELNIVQDTPHEPFRLVSAAGDEVIMEALVRNIWKPLYRFSLHEQYQIDYEMTSWYLCNHPESHFISSLIAAVAKPGHRYTLRNNELAIHTKEETIRTVFNHPHALRTCLCDTFEISPPHTPDMDIWLAKLTNTLPV